MAKLKKAILLGWRRQYPPVSRKNKHAFHARWLFMQDGLVNSCNLLIT